MTDNRFFKHIILFLLLLFGLSLNATTEDENSGNTSIINDSLFNKYDSKKVGAFLTKGHLDSAKNYLDDHLYLLDEDGDFEDKFYVASQYCTYYEDIGKLDSAEQFCQLALNISEDKLNFDYISKANTNLATLYTSQGKTETALNLLKTAYEIQLQNEDVVDLAFTLNNIGFIYFQHKEYIHAFEVFNEILDIEVDSTSERLEFIKANALLNMADIHYEFNEYDALRHLLIKLDKMQVFTMNKDFEGFIYLSLLKGKLAMGLNDMALAKKIFLLTVRESNKKEFPQPKLNSYFSIGNYYYKLKDYTSAYDAYERAYVISKNNRLLDFEYQVSLKLALTLKQINKDQSIYFFQKSINLSDSLFNQQKTAAVADMQAFHEVELQKEQNDVLRVRDHDNSKKLDEQKKFIEMSIVIVVLLLIFTYYIYLNQRKTKKLNLKLSSAFRELEMANIEVESVNSELLIKNDVLRDTLEHSKQQGKQLNYQHAKISSSIKSAHLIQSSILPSDKGITNAFPKNFIFNQPKDVVSGDFYWFTEQEGWKIYACIDCTGHGVPGALMSMMASSSLYEIVRGKKILSPGKILGELNNIVVRNLQQDTNDNNDGMDMTLIAIKGNVLKYAGAKNPLYIVRDSLIYKLAGTRKSIGGELDLVYEEHEWLLEKGDNLFMATDGYQDQFGGEKTRKFMVKRLRELYVEIATLPSSEQKVVLANTINKWMEEGQWEQIDDMLIIGIKI
ncbi:tetratricopeptide repeat protein [Flammeovirga pectinis]|uniref:Tetratricopeptide repeat protein n=1 Tax=Flammeovirga pectinis TaxID=2494373 RepID=A0A3Q9FKI7_9BACT|nr:SpoIIE family protein phosphatase [Flammeovirga pectinis]AZQ61803.1 tetratricopeptide repeat protein [Flammeovirga pectinis]